MPSLRVFWDRKKFGLAGDAAARTLFEGNPRVGVFAARHDTDPALTGVSVNPYMMAAGDEKIVADQLFALLSNPPHKDEAPAAAAAGRRPQRPSGTCRSNTRRRTSNHGLSLRQRGNEIDGSHRGDFLSRDLSGTIDGDSVRLRSVLASRAATPSTYTFTGKVTGDEMAGTLDMGEYLSGQWSARRRTARRG